MGANPSTTTITDGGVRLIDTMDRLAGPGQNGFTITMITITTISTVGTSLARR